MLIATFTFGDALLTTLEFALLFLWIWIAVDVVFDIFRSRDLSNAAKALWILFIVVLPLLGVLAYLVVRGHTMHEREVGTGRAMPRSAASAAARRREGRPATSRRWPTSKIAGCSPTTSSSERRPRCLGRTR